MNTSLSRDGILLIDKPGGISSAAAINIVKKRLKPGRIGHAGTLDPMAKGLLVVLTGHATRIADYVQAGTKEYSGSIRFGLVTDTDDITGNVLKTCNDIPRFEYIAESVKSFTGEIEQVPPNVSAVKVEGERAYELARKGQSPELKSRKVHVESFTVSLLENGDTGFFIRCSKGTYIRSLARDLGEKLGCGGCLSTLRRESSVPFHVDAAKSVDDVSWADLIPWELSLDKARKIFLPAREARLLKAGNEHALKEVSHFLQNEPGDNIFAVYYEAGTDRALGLLKRTGHLYSIAFNLPD